MAFFHLLVLSAFMFLSSLLAGCLPLLFSFKQSHLRFLTTYGVGLLIGTAFIVIIPEGIHTLYSSPHPAAHSSTSLAASTLSPLQWEYWRPLLPSYPPSHSPSLKPSAHNHPHRHLLHSDPPVDAYAHSHAHADADAASLVHSSADLDGHELPDCALEPEGSSYIGAALVFGFVFMLLVDRISGAPQKPRSRGAALSCDGKGAKGADDEVVQRTSVIHIPMARELAVTSAGTAANAAARQGEKEREVTPEKERERQRVEREKERERAHGYQPYASTSSSFSQSATLGILVHSAVDGVALGAISLASDPPLELLVFVAIVLHKCPAAFGLVSFLMYQGRGAMEIRAHLLVFSLCAPVAGLVTFVLLAAPGAASAASPAMLGLCLLFSGGTFLFTIAVHIMPELSKGEAGGGGHSHGGGIGDDDGEEEGDAEEGEGLLHSGHSHGGGEKAEGGEDAQPLEWKYVVCLITGILSPLVFAWRHTHSEG